MASEIWDSLEAHPAWRKILAAMETRQKAKFRELVAVGAQSSDPRVRGVAQELLSIDYLVTLPQQQRDLERGEEEEA